MQLTPEQKQVGTDNFNDAVGWSRRDFLKGVAAGGVGLGATYFGYEQLQGSPVKVAWIGTGDEGSVLLNEHPTGYMDITAVADLRPSNRERAFTGDGNDARRGLSHKDILGPNAKRDIKVYDSHTALLKAIGNKEVEVEAVVIAVPLNQHAPLAIECLDAGLHVLTEKLMAHDIGQCKAMIRAARKNNKLLAVGHQRHYNVLYDNANNLVQKGMLGTIKHIRAHWHRNNSFYLKDSWRKDTGSDRKAYIEDKAALEKAGIDVRQFGFEDYEHLANWRLYEKTGGGLMAELGSHQLDACSIFLGKVHPISVMGYGGKNFYGVSWKDADGNLTGLGPKDKWEDSREIADHVYTIFEFPGPHYADDPDDIVIVTYSSINTNTFEPYGEAVYGSRATLLTQMETQTLLYPQGGGYEKRITVVEGQGGPAIETSDSLSPSAAAAVASGATGKKVSRGYTEEMEHFCWAIRNVGPEFYPDGKPIPAGPETKGLRCPDVQGMGDAIMALTSNLAMKHKQRIEFKPEWFDPNHEATPEADVAKMFGKKA
jgi:predicted dehydrogenase